VGGLAVYLYVSQAEELAGRTTRDIDVAVDRADLPKISRLAGKFGFQYRHAAGMDMLLDTLGPDVRQGVHFVFTQEKVRPDYVEPVPDFRPDPPMSRGAYLIPLPDLLRMKLTSFRLKDQVHIKDLDEVGLITAGIEAQLSPILRQRLARVRAVE
jgi:hypothetical protein